MLAFGAVYDLAFGVGILTFTRPLASFLRLDVPVDPVYLHLNGVFLLVLAGVYAAAARQPERYSAIAPIAAGARAIGCLFFLWAWAGGRPIVFLALGLADLAVGLATLIAWRHAVVLSD